jgi:hypothetical protein
VPHARVGHDHRTELREWWLRKAYYGTGAAALAQRHPGLTPPMVLTRSGAATVVLLMAGRPALLASAAVLAAVDTVRLSRRLRVDRPVRTAARLVGRGTVGAVTQAADGVTRHFWPLSLLACLASRRARRTVAVIALGEAAVDWWRHRDRATGVRPNPVEYLLAHRLDDIAYGAGLWWGAWRHRSGAALRPIGARAATGGPRSSPAPIGPARSNLTEPAGSDLPNG